MLLMAHGQLLHVQELNHSANIKLSLYDFFYRIKPLQHPLSWSPSVKDCWMLFEAKVNDINAMKFWKTKKQKKNLLIIYAYPQI